MDEGEEMYVTSMQIFNFMLTAQTLSSISVPVLLLNDCLFTFSQSLYLYIKILKSKVWSKLWLACECMSTCLYVYVLSLNEFCCQVLRNSASLLQPQATYDISTQP